MILQCVMCLSDRRQDNGRCADCGSSQWRTLNVAAEQQDSLEESFRKECLTLREALRIEREKVAQAIKARSEDIQSMKVKCDAEIAKAKNSYIDRDHHWYRIANRLYLRLQEKCGFGLYDLKEVIDETTED